MKIILKHQSNNKIKVAHIGFSWTTLFFGYWVALFRGDWKIFLPFFAIYLSPLLSMPWQEFLSQGFTGQDMIFSYSFQINDLISNLNNLDFIGFMTLLFMILIRISFFINILGALFYNKIFTQALLNKSYLPVSIEMEELLLYKGFNVPRQDFH